MVNVEIADPVVEVSNPQNHTDEGSTDIGFNLVPDQILPQFHYG